MAKETQIDVTVQVDEAHRDKLGHVTSSLRGKGFVLKESLKEIGVLLGSAPADAVDALSSVEGVAAVEQQRTDYRTQD